MKFSTILLISLYAAIAVPSQAAMKPFTHPKSGLTINLPERWIAKAGKSSNEPDIAVANNPDAFSANPPSDTCVGTFVIGKTSDIGMTDPVEATRAFADNVSAVSKISKKGITLRGERRKMNTRWRERGSVTTTPTPGRGSPSDGMQTAPLRWWVA